MIFWAMYISYNIFTDQMPAPEIFEIPEDIAKKESSVDLTKSLASGLDQSVINDLIGEQIKEIFPSALLADLFNLIAWSIFVGILIFAGSQIAGLGIRLIKLN